MIETVQMFSFCCAEYFFEIPDDKEIRDGKSVLLIG